MGFHLQSTLKRRSVDDEVTRKNESSLPTLIELRKLMETRSAEGTIKVGESLLYNMYDLTKYKL